ncbi:MAG: DUF378 domain-containing protein [Deltaproteobacteria bacterium]|nr:DUF378 domain-containing protein [Deltaproteobacteria bacterium]
MKTKCFVCNIVGLLVIIGALNWGLVGIFQLNVVDAIFGEMSILGRVLYSLVGLAGVMKLITCFKDCPKCKKEA